MPMFGYEKSTGKKILATKDTPPYKKGEIIDGCPLSLHPEMYLKNKGEHTKPHWAHYISDNLGYYSEETDSHDIAVLKFANWFGIDYENVEHWIIGDNIESSVLIDVLYGKYAVEFQHGNIPIAEFRRRMDLYEKLDLVPIWIFHAEEKYLCRRNDSDDDNKSNMNKWDKFKEVLGVGHYCGIKLNCAISDIQKADTQMSRKIERSVSRLQGYMLYYQYDYKSDLIDPTINFFCMKAQKCKKKKQTYEVVENSIFDITNKENFDYIASKIDEKYKKYRDFKKTEKYNPNIHYAYNEDSDEWFEDTIKSSCNKCQKSLYFPIGMIIPSDYKCRMCVDSEIEIKSQELDKIDKLDYVKRSPIRREIDHLNAVFKKFDDYRKTD